MRLWGQDTVQASTFWGVLNISILILKYPKREKVVIFCDSHIMGPQLTCLRKWSFFVTHGEPQLTCLRKVNLFVINKMQFEEVIIFHNKHTNKHIIKLYLIIILISIPVGFCPSCISQPDLTLAVLTWLGWLNSRLIIILKIPTSSSSSSRL